MAKQMKLSEMNTQQLAVCLCKIAPALERIGMDEGTNRAFAALSGKLEGGTRMQQLAQMFGALVPALLGTHFDDMVTIVAAMTGKTEEGVRAQNGFATIRDVKSFFDEDFLDFFKSSAAQEQNA